MNAPLDIENALLILEAHKINQTPLGIKIVTFMEKPPELHQASSGPDNSDLIPFLHSNELSYQQRQISNQLSRIYPSTQKNMDNDAIDRLLLKTYLHRLCLKRLSDPLKGKSYSGLGVVLPKESNVRHSDFFLALSGQEKNDEIWVRHAHGLTKDFVVATLVNQIQVKEEIEFDHAKKSFYVLKVRTIGAIEIDQVRAEARFQDARNLVEIQVAKDFPLFLEDQIELKNYKIKVAWIIDFLKTKVATQAELKILSDLQLFFQPETLEIFISQLLEGESQFQSVFQKNWMTEFSYFLNVEFSESHRFVENNFPNEIQLKKVKRTITYLPEGPQCESKLQDFLGLRSHPSIYKESIPLRLVMLGPHYRPIQVTSDLIRFWSSSYPAIRKELRGQYPKHAWPENPLEDDH